MMGMDHLKDTVAEADSNSDHTSFKPAGEAGFRVFTATDAAEFALAAKAFVAANTATPEAARTCLRNMGLIDAEGKLTEQYR